MPSHNCFSVHLQDLIDDLKSELSGDFEKVMVGLIMTPTQYDAHELKSAIKVRTAVAINLAFRCVTQIQFHLPPTNSLSE